MPDFLLERHLLETVRYYTRGHQVKREPQARACAAASLAIASAQTAHLRVACKACADTLLHEVPLSWCNSGTVPEAFEERALPGTPGQLLLLGKLTHAMVQLTVIRSPGQRAD